jgi:8-amino-7-oxononanoate synthase
MKPLVEDLSRRLEELADQGLERRLSLPRGIDFSSNDYLGLAGDGELRRALAAHLASLPEQVPLLAPASRLLRGHTPAHAELEARFARYKGTEGALLFPSGYQANLGVLTALIGPADRALSDAQNHASLIDGLRLSGCRKVIYPHLDLAAVAAELAREHAPGRTFVVTESLFSMDGDIAPLARLAELAGRHGAELIVDDAHATGLYGEERGSGLAEHCGIAGKAAAVVSTLGKSFGLSGAFVGGPRAVLDYLVHRCRPFVFSTAVPPLLVEALAVALRFLEARPERRGRVLALADRLRRQLRAAGLDVLASAGPIVPVVLGDNRRAVAVAQWLQARGFDVRAVRPPTVAAGTARLRISVHADHAEEQIDALAAAVARAVAETAVPAVGAVAA